MQCVACGMEDAMEDAERLGAIATEVETRLVAVGARNNTQRIKDRGFKNITKTKRGEAQLQ
jgi:hypothetical protein